MTEGGDAKLQAKVEHLTRLHRVGMALTQEHDKNGLLERILLEAKDLCQADGGTLYLRTDEDTLKFEIMRTDTLGIALGGTTGKPIGLPDVPMFDAMTGEPNHHNVASYCATTRQSVNIRDAYDAEGFDFSGTKEFDKVNGYRSKSFLTIPMLNQAERLIGVLQLLNAGGATGDAVEFAPDLQEIVEALASQAAVALDNHMLMTAQRDLMESFIKLMATAIDEKSPYTGAHCRRVPMVTEMLAQAACEATEGPFKDFELDKDEWYTLHIAGWLHDCGKVTTPVHVMDKGTKLETIYDRITTVNARFEILKRDAELDYLRKPRRTKATKEKAKRAYEEELAQLVEEQAFVAKANIGGEFMKPDDIERLQAIARRTFTNEKGEEQALLSEEELKNLSIARGTLTQEERLIINGHMVQTIRMLDQLPFPRQLKEVPAYACGHHERMDGTGYPRGLFAGDMPIPARMMAIADVFEALTANDRPYKPAKKLSETMRIMGFMKRDNHLDPELLDLFVQSGVYREYAEKYLPPELIDEVDEQAILDTQPKEFELPPPEDRLARGLGFLPEYEHLVNEQDWQLPGVGESAVSDE